jgi:endonuclease/exonuclease/phosphatase family metal-dependent hydrolase
MADAPPLRLATLNAHSGVGPDRLEALSRALIDNGVDVVSVAELSETRAELLAQASGLRHRLSSPADFLANHVLSRYPLRVKSGQEVDDNGAVLLVAAGNQGQNQGERRSAALAEVLTPSGMSLGVCAVHLDHRSEERRLAQAAVMMAHCEGNAFRPPSQEGSRGPGETADGVVTRLPASLVARRSISASAAPPHSGLSGPRRWGMANDFFVMGDLNATKRSDYTEEQWRRVDARRQAAWLEKADDHVMAMLLDQHALQDACPDRAPRAGEEAEAASKPPQGYATELEDLCSVAATSSYGTRVDYILRSPQCSWEFVPESYNVVNLIAQNVTDHNMVCVDVRPVHAKS